MTLTWRKLARVLGCAAIALFCCAGASRAAEDWLVGKWDGNIDGLSGDSGVRDLMVASVNADGSLVGRWGQKTHLAVSGRASGDGVKLIIAVNGNRITLHREGGDRLVGTFTARKKDYPLTLARAQGAGDFAAGKSCIVPFYDHRNIYVGTRTVPEGDEYTQRGSHRMMICRDGRSVFVDP